ncbi:transposase [Paenibacillus sp. FSL M8-0228]|jgi:hypothetical protein|uniref:hypothetical protein n=1 Tax=Paenibacillus TaxID=44249 RepID=UPI00083E0960|nr:hypothetical protein [Paenibacillus polymyxa]MBY0020735.1 transposase [Paenibacillus polymyxa]MBY0059039.1 transposase [Paenibacillus polymyxa]MBY0069626.1 transposase [Paenibacillus polymyxa]MBY0078868.1 transposase [Paenibacillus polymyxa]MBZ6441858.1 transposase [Paenibacillus polymyxa]
MAGRPSKYESHVQPKLLLIEAWARDGLTEADICKNLDVGKDAFISYKKEYPELVEALKNGKEVIDVMVENALLKAALGYEYRDEELNKATGEPIELRKTAHPNTTALIFWLKNRKPKEWRDKQEIGLEGDLNIKVSLPKGFGADADD